MTFCTVKLSVVKGQINEKFLMWFVGFFEGDGYTSIANRGDLALGITQKDPQILFLIRNSLNVGKVHKQGKNTFRFIVQSESEILVILNILNGKLQLNHRNKQIYLFISAYNKRYNTNIKHYVSIKPLNLDNAWLSGFVDAEGCFSVQLFKKNYLFRIRFILGQKNEFELLNRIKILLSNGSIEHKSDNFYTYVLDGLKNVALLFSYFDRFPLKSQKAKSYKKWVSLYYSLKNKDHLKSRKRARMSALSRKINQK